MLVFIATYFCLFQFFCPCLAAEKKMHKKCLQICHFKETEMSFIVSVAIGNLHTDTNALLCVCLPAFQLPSHLHKMSESIK